MTDPVTTYAQAVVTGSVVAGKYHRLACARHLRDLERMGQPGFGYVWAPDLAERFFRFAAKLKHWKGEWAGQPVQLQPHQVFRLGCLFGWVDGVTRLRRWRTAYCEIPRKNGKTFEAAMVALYCTFFAGERGANGFAIATKRAQAKLVFTDAQKIIKASGMSRLFRKLQVGCIEDLATDSKFEPLGKDADSTDGLNAHLVIVDELHAHKDRSLIDVMRTATGARREPLVFEITTAGSDRASVCYEHHEYSQRLLDGVFEDDTWFAFIASIDPGDDWTDEAAWYRANPNLGVSVKIDVLRANAEKAKRVPADQNAFRRLYLNQWTEQEDRWLDMEAWRACAGQVDAAALTGRACYAGLDLSSTADLTSYVLVFRMDDGRIQVLPRFYLPEARLAARAERKDRVPLESWRREGWLRVTPGNVVDYEVVRQDILADSRMYELREVSVDPWNATHLKTQLEADGLTCVDTRQGFATLSAPTKRLETLVLSRQIDHGGHPVLAWCASNVAVEQDPAGNIKPSKKRARDRIDGIVALVMGLSCEMVHQDAPEVCPIHVWG